MENTKTNGSTHSTAIVGAIELYSAATPNGIKVAACLEEICATSEGKFTYEPVTIDLSNAHNRAESYLQINPSGKIPTIVDTSAGVIMFESGAILLYLAEKYHILLSIDTAQRTEMTNWLFWGSCGLSNHVKQFGFYYKSCPHSIPYCVARYAEEVKRELHVLDRHLSDGREFIMGGLYTVADISTWPWIYALVNISGAVDEVFGGLRDVPWVVQWYERCMDRPASQKAIRVCSL